MLDCQEENVNGLSGHASASATSSTNSVRAPGRYERPAALYVPQRDVATSAAAAQSGDMWDPFSPGMGIVVSSSSSSSVAKRGGAVVGPIVPAATSADLRAGVEVRGLALGLGLHGQPYTMLPRGRARSAR